ncbi:unnamed protein product [Owenia fusiformis]|uniref:Uncharacterized protein n=1 Tax=Owenia fusiformis TaxID=6347 RepID=A0A8J1ULB7_OWEFU|nr:unnamed protein product [Owenia fusiformis]
MTMKGYLTVALIITGCVSGGRAFGVDINAVKAIFDVADSQTWIDFLKDPSKAGRSGLIVIDLGPNFFDAACEGEKTQVVGRNGDVCFIVQTSCRNYNVMKSIKKDIKDILGKLKYESFYTTITYSDNARQAKAQNKRWIVNAKRVYPGRLRVGEDCNDCQARTDKALEKCEEYFNDTALNGRETVPKTIVLFTDGVSFGDKFMELEATRKLTIDKLIEIQKVQRGYELALQVVKINQPSHTAISTFNDEWGMMSYIPAKFPERVHVNKLGENNDQDVEIAVAGEKLVDELVPKPCCTADVVFIIDTSDSINSTDIQLLLDFVHGFIEVQEKMLNPKADDKTYGLQIAVLTYCGAVKVHATLGEKSREELMTIIDGISNKSCTFTSTHLALKSALHQLDKTPKARKEPHVRKIAVLATDGRTYKVGTNQAYTGPDTINAAKAIKNIGDGRGEVFLVGLPNKKLKTTGVNDEWPHLPSAPTKCNFVDMRNGTFEDLSAVGKYLTKKICYEKDAAFCFFDDKKQDKKEERD